MSTLSDNGAVANGNTWVQMMVKAREDYEQEHGERIQREREERTKHFAEAKENFLDAFCSILKIDRETVKTPYDIRLSRNVALGIHATFTTAYWFDSFKYWYDLGAFSNGEGAEQFTAEETESVKREWEEDAQQKAREELKKELVQRKLANHEAETEVKTLIAASTWSAPDQDENTENTGSLFDQLVRERPQLPQLIEGLAGRVHNVSITAPYKTGKTTFGINVMRSLVDEDEFLGRATHLPAGGNVGWWNGEMDIEDWLDYARPVDPENGDRIFPLHLRGRSVPILSDVAAEWTIKWLKDNNIKVWWLDSWRVLCAWNGINENDNTGGGQLTARIDEIKTAAGVDAFFVLAHTGRSQQAEGEERARGMTALDDWVDARWVLTKQQDRRFFAASGRNIKWGGTGTAMVFDQETNLITLGAGDRRSGRDMVANSFIFDVLIQRGPMNTTALKQALHGCGIDGMTNTDAKTAALSSAVLAGVATTEPRGNSIIYTAGRDPRETTAAISGGMGWVARTQ